MRASILGFIAAAAVAGCTLLTGPDVQVVGIVEWVGAADVVGEPALEAPDTVDAGAEFEIVVRTYGLNSCWRSDGGRVTRTAGAVDIVPYDRDGSSGRSCRERIVRLPRTFTESFDSPGEARIRINGRRVVDDEAGEPVDEEVILVKDVVVR